MNKPLTIIKYKGKEFEVRHVYADNTMLVGEKSEDRTGSSVNFLLKDENNGISLIVECTPKNSNE